ncbi:MAG: dihydrolipoyl dehydrogenase [Planctomycetia bacterium]|nr:dihydrolipoyl dehydrogenase [Planctomycetia bacterium]
MTDSSFDLIVVGGGPGGTEAALYAARMGKHVALIERDSLGGTCLNCGCIPTKFLFHQAEVIRELKTASENGLVFHPESLHVDLVKMTAKKDELINQFRKGLDSLLVKAGVVLLHGTAHLTAANELEIIDAAGATSSVTSERILLATGSQPARPVFPGSDLPCVIDSTAMLNQTEVPRELVVLGGGVIGLEFASIFQEFGTHVTVLEAMDSLLPAMDRELGRRLSALLKRRGVAIQTGSKLTAVIHDDGQNRVLFENATGETSIPADLVLVAVGRLPVVPPSDVTNALTRNGRFLAVNERFETSLPGVYAIGDLVGHGMLAHVAEAEARAAVTAMFTSNAVSVPRHAIPACVFTCPEIASVGLTSEQAAAQNIPVTVRKSLFAANGKARSMSASDGFVKILLNAQNIIVGVHIIGPHASDLIAEAALLVTHHMTLNQAQAVVHAHPTLSETLAHALAD